MTRRDLNQRLFDAPFRPFRIHLSDGTTLPVVNAGMLIVGESSVILPVETANDPDGYPYVKRWRTLALSHVVQFSDIDEPVSGKRPKKRGRG